MFNLKNTLVAAALSLAAVGSASAGEWVLDSFDTYDGTNAGALVGNNGYLSVNALAPVTFSQDTEVSPHGIVTATVVQTGGTEEVVGAGIGATGGSAFASPVTTTNDKLTFNQDDGVSAKLGLFYTAPVAFLPLDLTAQGSAFYFDVLTIDTSFTLDLYAIADFDIFDGQVLDTGFLADLYDNGTDIDTGALASLDYAHKAITVPNAFSAPDRLTATFDSFTQVNGGTDFSNITALFAVISGDPAADLSIDEVGIVPEPTTLAIFGLGLLGLGLSRRRA